MIEDSRSHDIDYAALDSWHVVVDTSAMLGSGSRKDADFKLARPATQVFLQRTQPPIFYLSIPYVVVLEMSNHYREELQAARNRLDMALRDLGQLLGRPVTADVLAGESSAEADMYEEWFIQELARHGARIQPLPESLHGAEKLIRDELAGRRPFGERRRGGGNRGERSSMRDALIWASVMELCRHERRSLAFISGNTGDFADDSNLGLHPDLLSEFEALREPRQKIRFYPSIRTFVDDPPTSPGSDIPLADSQSPGDMGASTPPMDDTTD
jgi:hypothetical protein